MGLLQPLSEPILRGRLQDLDVSSLLSALRLGRQYLTLEVYDSVGDCTGVVAVKAGRIVSASVEGYTGTEAVRRLLRTRNAAEFRVLPQLQVEDVTGEPLGTIEEITQSISESGVHTLSTRTPVLQGVLSEQLGFDDLLRGLSFSRQHITVALTAASGDALGEVSVKAGKVLSAQAGDLVALPALEQLRRAPAGSNFVLFTESQDIAPLHPLGSVAELLNKAEASSFDTDEVTETLTLSRALELGAPDNAGPNPIPVMDGRLGELDVPSILQVTGASRQYTCVHIFDDQRKPLGVIHLKSGQVVRAQAQDVTGVAAVRRLLHCPRDFSFLVQRYPNASEVTSSIGSITEVLMRAATHVAPASGTRTTPKAAKRRAALSNTWMGAVLGASFVLLGGISTALLLRPPTVTPVVAPVAAQPEKPTPPTETVMHPALQLPREEPELHPTKADTPPVEPAPADAAAPPSRATIASLQAGLRQLGYETGAIDGVIGPRTAAAIKAFQFAEHLTADGTLSPATRAVLLRRIGEP